MNIADFKTGQTIEARSKRSVSLRGVEGTPVIKGEVLCVNKKDQMILIKTPEGTELVLYIIDFIIKILPEAISLWKKIAKFIGSIFKKK